MIIEVYESYFEHVKSTENIPHRYQEMVLAVFHNENVYCQHKLHKFLVFIFRKDDNYARNKSEYGNKPRPLNTIIFGRNILIFCSKTSAPAVISSLKNMNKVLVLIE